MVEIQEVLLSKEQIRQKVIELGTRISMDYKDKEVILIGVLKGGCVFLADLMREIKVPLEIDFISVSSYGNSSQSSGVVRIIKDIDIDITGKNIIIVEDIVDSGLTLNYLKDLFKTRHPESVRVCTILDKPSRRKVDIQIDYDGFEIPDEFVVGYGLDFAGKYRNLPDVCIIKND